MRRSAGDGAGSIRSQLASYLEGLCMYLSLVNRVNWVLYLAPRPLAQYVFRHNAAQYTRAQFMINRVAHAQNYYCMNILFSHQIRNSVREKPEQDTPLFLSAGLQQYTAPHPD